MFPSHAWEHPGSVRFPSCWLHLPALALPWRQQRWLSQLGSYYCVGDGDWVPSTQLQLHSSSSHRGHVGGDRADRNSPPLKYMNKQINCMYSHIGYFNVRHSACGTDRSPQRPLSQISILVCSIPCDFCYWCILFNWYCVLVDWSVKKELTAKSVLLWIMINNIHAFQK